MSTGKEFKTWPRRDFIWMCIVFGIVLVGFIVWTLGGNEDAAKKFDFAGVIVSIVLAVIAIIMPLIDSAGQKENINQMKDTVKLMGDSVQEVRDLLDSTANQFSEVVSLKSELLSMINENQIWQKEMSENISSMNEKLQAIKASGEGSNNLSSLEEDMKKLNELANSNPTGKLKRLSNNPSTVRFSVVGTVLDGMKDHSEIADALTSTFPGTTVMRVGPFRQSETLTGNTLKFEIELEKSMVYALSFTRITRMIKGGLEGLLDVKVVTREL